MAVNYRELTKLKASELYAIWRLIEDEIQKKESEEYGVWCFTGDENRTPMRLVKKDIGFSGFVTLESECGEYRFSGSPIEAKENLMRIDQVSF